MAPSWPYHFMSLSEDELRSRRAALDLRGYVAQLSALAVIVIVSLYCRIGARSSSTKLKKPRDTSSSSWKGPPRQGGAETRKQYALILIWLGWLIGLCIWKSGEDYLHLTKALAHVSLSQLPVQFLLAPTSFLLRTHSVPSLLSLMTTIPQPTLTAYHSLLGRLVLVPLLCAHAALYLNFFVQTPDPTYGSLLAKRIRDSDVAIGILGIIIATLILVLRGPTLRRWSGTMLVASTPDGHRKGFYVVHLGLVTVLLVFAYAHVVFARVFVLEAVGTLTVSLVVCRLLDRRRRIERV